jgi:SAM-dependent methyltransferase
VPAAEFARVGFGRGAEAYARARPAYPGPAVAWLVDALGIGPGRTVLDVGAGTGKLTALLVATGARIVAVEPVDAMRAALARTIPGVEVVDAVAEALPFPTGSIDAIVAAQAFHWFDPERALAEFHRVLRPDGRLGLVWNAWDAAVPWVATLRELMDGYASAAPYHKDWRASLDANPSFGPLTSAEFTNEQVLDRAGLIDRFLSISFIASLDEHARNEAVARLLAVPDEARIAAADGSVTVPYRTKVHWTQRTELEAE